MKSNHGKRVLFVWLFLTGVLFGASDYTWQVTTSKTAVYQHEAVEVHYSCRFKDQGELYSIEIDPPRETAHYSMHILSEKEQIHDGIRTNEYRYVLFPLKPGTILLEPTVLMRKTTRASIENTVIGRDNIEELVFTDQEVILPKAEIDVKPTSSVLSGRLTLTAELSQMKVNAYEPVHLTVTLEGTGNLDEVTPFVVKVDGVELFEELPESSYELGAEGFRGKLVQRFALVASESFAIPPFELHYFDLDEKREKQLTTEAYRIEVVEAVAKEKLLDEEESMSWEWEWSYLFYLLTFVTGYIAGKWLHLRRDVEPKDNSLGAKIRRCKSLKQLMTLLVITEEARFYPLVEKLDREDAPSLNSAKKEALEILYER